MKRYKIYCGGEFIETSEVVEIKNKYSNSIYAETFQAGAWELERAIERGLSVKEELGATSSYVRYEILMEIARAIERDKEIFTEILCAEAGKPYKYSLAEVDRAVQVFVIAAEEAKRLPAEYIYLDQTAAGKNREGLVRYFPVGLVAGIAPFNFPLNLAVHKIAPAIATGCPIILKPASSTPLSTVYLSQIIDKTGLLKGAVSIMPMDRETGNRLVTDERINLLSFTGSPEVGWQMKKDCGKKKIVLELGGNAAAIITESADLGFAVKRAIMGAYAYSGQVCIHTQRFYVHKNIFGEFTQRFIEEANKLKRGDVFSPDTDISVMIDEINAKRIEEWVNAAIGQGAKLLCGGHRSGSYYEPTALTDTNKTMDINSKENFGPVVTIDSYCDFEEAVAQVNDTNFGLQAGVFTDKIKEMNYAFKRIETGGVIINDVPTFRVDSMPYGGIKDSGFGREGVRYAMMDMLVGKLLVKSFI